MSVRHSFAEIDYLGLFLCTHARIIHPSRPLRSIDCGQYSNSDKLQAVFR